MDPGIGEADGAEEKEVQKGPDPPSLERRFEESGSWTWMQASATIPAMAKSRCYRKNGSRRPTLVTPRHVDATLRFRAVAAADE